MSKVSSGINGLDVLMKGGFIPGRTYLLTGNAGSGKTTIGAQFINHGITSEDENCLYITLEESKKKIIEDVSLMGIDLKEAEKSGKLIFIGGALANIHKNMKRFDAKINHIISEIEEVVKTHSIKRVVVDSLNILTLLCDNENELRTGIASLCNVLSSAGCISLLLGEREEHSKRISKHGIEEFIVDGVLVLYQFSYKDSFLQGVAVKKYRGSNHVKEIKPYRITDKGVIVYPKEYLFTDDSEQ